jgi:hypothetical protein
MKLSYWQWLIRGSGDKPGFLRFVDWWFPLHICVGISLSATVPSDLEKAATSILLPLTGVLIGLTFAWSGNAQALLSSPEIDALAEHRVGGLMEYVYSFQSAILLILITVSSWGVAGLGIIDANISRDLNEHSYFWLSTALYTLISLTIRECWHVVLFSQWLVLVRHEINKSKRGS